MSEKYKVKDNQALYFVTLTIIDWVDVFTNEKYKEILIESLNYCKLKKELVVYAYVIMSNHIHLIVSASEGNEIPAIIRDFKKFTSKAIIESIREGPESRTEWLLNKFKFAADRIKRNKNFKVWQDGFRPKELNANKMINQKLDYIHNNPVKAGIVYQPEHYKYSSAVNYSGGVDAVLEVEYID